MKSPRLLHELWQDIRYGGRLLAKNPTFTIVAVLTLALGTGANAAIFHLVNSVRLRTLPVEQPQDLVSLSINTHGKGRSGRFMSRRPFFSEPQYRGLLDQQQAFTHLIAWGITTWNIARDGEYRAVQGLLVGGGYFAGLGLAPHVGRLITEADDRTGCGAPGAVLNYGFWQAQYGGSPAAIGQDILLDGRAFPIIGVTPPNFFGTEVGRTFDVAVPLCAEPLFRGEQSALGRPDVWFLDIMARLRPGWTVERAQAQLDSISPGIFSATVSPRYNAETAKNYAAFRFTVTEAPTGVSALRRTYATQLWVLLGATGLVLLITCANLANLMLARATARQRELALRLAIGASRPRLIRQLLAESFLLAALGAAGGIVLAQWLGQSLVAFLSTENARLFVDLTPDWRLLAFVAAVAVAACLLFGASPALAATRTDPARAMQSGGRSSSDAGGRFGLRRGLVVLQVALSMVLIVGALLFARSLQNLTTVDAGFEPEGVLVVSVDLRRSALDEQARAATYAQIVERVRAVPGVRAAVQTFIVPMSGSGWNQQVVVDGEKKDGNANFNRVGPDYFTVIGTPLLAGRTFGGEDRPGTPPVAIVNETFAKKYFGAMNPIGRSFQLDASPGEPQRTYEVVGLVKDTKYTDLREEFVPIGYFPVAHELTPAPFVDLLVRSDVAPAAITASLTRTVRDVTPGATVSYETIDRYIRDSLVIERLMAVLSGFFGVMAMLIATVGLYGVMSYAVSRRRVEIGIRMALGADARSVVRRVLGESALLFGLGVLVGVPLAVLASRWAASLLFGLKPWDPASIAIALAALGSVSLAAAWIPARRASRVAPTVALRAE